jgi:hypothetical protein
MPNKIAAPLLGYVRGLTGARLAGELHLTASALPCLP